MKVSIGKRLGVLSGVGVVLLLLVTVVGTWSSGRVDQLVRKLGKTPESVRGAAYADMNHDAISNDVTALQLATDPSVVADRATKLAKHQQLLREQLATVKQGAHSPAVADAVDAVASDVDAYVAATSAVAASAKAGKVTDEAMAQFDKTFKVLEDKLPSITKAAEDLVAAETKQASDAAARGRTISILLTIVAVIALSALAVVISRTIVRPVRRAADTLNGVAHGNLGQRLEVNTHDELGEMAAALNTALENLSNAMASISDHSGSLASSSEELTAVSSQLAMTAEDTSAQASVVSAAAEQVSGNVSTVAAGTGQMASSIQQVSYNAQSAVRVASEAAMVAESTNHTVAKLGASSAEIGSVVKVITSIAEQTNLLALNATIEAARAGEAGKGFAVVAHEVKELARATAGATADISERITAIQADAEAAVMAIGEITEIIGRVSETQSSIASAVDEQTATTAEIGNNVSEAAHGSTEIARNVSKMAEAFTQASIGAAQTREAATELSRMAHELQQLVGAFQY